MSNCWGTKHGKVSKQKEGTARTVEQWAAWLLDNTKARRRNDVYRELAKSGVFGGIRGQIFNELQRQRAPELFPKKGVADDSTRKNPD